jgi:hypothetical protein
MRNGSKHLDGTQTPFPLKPPEITTLALPHRDINEVPLGRATHLSSRPVNPDHTSAARLKR